MSNVQIAVWLWRKACMYRIIDTLCQILVDELLDKISGYDLLLPVRNFKAASSSFFSHFIVR